MKGFVPDPAGSSGAVCLVCMESIQLFAVGKCNHRNICARCNVKQRLFFKDLACLMCKAALSAVIYTTHATRPYDSFVEKDLVTSAVLGGGLTHEPATRKLLEGLFECACPLCGPVLPPFPDREALAVHVTRHHGLFYCPVCLHHRPVFLSEQLCFASKAEMTSHMVKGDDKTHMKGHPKCKFCNEHFYGDDQLYEHMKAQHFECPVCRGRGVLYQYYRGYKELRRHWADSQPDHFVCGNATCEMAVFGTDMEWRQHQLQVHGAKLSKQEARRLLNVTDVFEIRLKDDRRERDSSSRVGFGTAANDNNNNNSSNGTNVSTAPAASSAAASSSNSASNSLALAVQQLPQPPATEAEARARNGAVMQRMREILDEDVFVHFRESAQRYREGTMPPQEYFDAFVGIFGEEEAARLFPQVVSLLPNAEKRGILFDIYTRFYHNRKVPVEQPPPVAATVGAPSAAATPSAAASKKAAKGRKCAACKVERLLGDFSKNQLKRPNGESKCKACLGEGAAAPAVAAPAATLAPAPAAVVEPLGPPPGFDAMLRSSPSNAAAVVAPPPGFGGADEFPALPAEKKQPTAAKSSLAPAAAGGRNKKNKQVLLRFG